MTAGKLAATRRRPEDTPLTTRQQVFLNEYLRTWNGTAAARKAGYAFPEVSASKLLRKAKVRQAVTDRLSAMHLTADAVLARLAEIATANLADFFTPAGRIKWAEVQKRGYLLHKAKKTKTGFELELKDGMAALVHIGKHLGLFTEKVEVGAPGGGPITSVTINMTPDELEATAPKEKETEPQP